MQKHRDVLGERHHEKHRLSASKTVAEDHEQKRRPEAAGGSKGGGFAAGPVREAHGEGKGGAVGFAKGTAKVSTGGRWVLI